MVASLVACAADPDRAAPEGLAMRAKDTFTRGDRVRLTTEGRQLTPNSAATTGTVVGFGHDRHLVRVLRDGRRTTTTYAMWFWEHISAPVTKQ